MGTLNETEQSTFQTDSQTLSSKKNLDDERGLVSVEELIPSLEHYDPSLLELLPQKLRLRAKERVRQLEESSSKGNISRYLVKQPAKAAVISSTACDNSSDGPISKPVTIREETSNINEDEER